MLSAPIAGKMLPNPENFTLALPEMRTPTDTWYGGGRYSIGMKIASSEGVSLLLAGLGACWAWAVALPSSNAKQAREPDIRGIEAGLTMWVWCT